MQAVPYKQMEESAEVDDVPNEVKTESPPDYSEVADSTASAPYSSEAAYQQHGYPQQYAYPPQSYGQQQVQPQPYMSQSYPQQQYMMSTQPMAPTLEAPLGQEMFRRPRLQPLHAAAMGTAFGGLICTLFSTWGALPGLVACILALVSVGLGEKGNQQASKILAIISLVFFGIAMAISVVVLVYLGSTIAAFKSDSYESDDY